MRAYFYWTICIIASLGGMGCSVTKDMDEMKQKTSQMANTTDKMSETTTALKEETSEVKDMTSSVDAGMTNTYMDLRQGNSLILRDGDTSLTAIDRAQNIKKKITKAMHYYMSFEFQLWKKTGLDTEDRRLDLMHRGAAEYFNSIQEWVKNPAAVSPTSKSNRMQNLYALAFALDSVNPNQILLAKTKGFKEISMLSIIEDGLRADFEIRAGRLDSRKAPAYINEVINNKEVAIYLLRLRHNFMAAAPISNLASMEYTGFLGIKGLFKSLKLLFVSLKVTHWEVDLAVREASWLWQYSEYLRLSTEARDFLKSIGVNSPLNKQLRQVYLRMKVKAHDPNATLTAELISAMGEFSKRVQDLTMADAAAE